MRSTVPSVPGEVRPRAARTWVIVILATACSVAVLYIAGFDPVRWLREREATVEAQQARNPPAAPRLPISVVQPTPTGTASSVSTVPLALHLVAVRPGRNASEGYADIGVEVQSPQTYRAGALLVNGAKLSEIYADHIVLTRGGRSAQLYLEGHAQPDSALLALAGSILTAGGVPATPLARATSQDALTDVMRVSPAYEGDRLLGLELYAAGDGAGFRALGLQPGDRVATIEGTPVTDVALALEALRSVTKGRAVTIELYRGGHPISLSLDGTALQSSSNLHGDSKAVRS